MLGLSWLRGGCAAAGLLLSVGPSLIAGTLALAPGQPVGGGGSSSSTRFGIVGSIGQAVAASDAASGGGFSARAGLWTHMTASLDAPPRLAGATNATIAELAGYTQAMGAQHPNLPAQALTVKLEQGPTGMVLTNGVLAWTPTEAQGPSTNTVVVSVTDGVTGTTNTFTLVVTEVNRAPAFAGATNGTLPELVGFARDLGANDADVPAQALTVKLEQGPTGMVLTDGVLAWTPTEAQGPSTNTVVVSVNDGVTGTTNTFTLVVTEVNVAPLAVSDVVERRAGQSVRVWAATLLANDLDADGDLLVLTFVTPLTALGGRVVVDGEWVVYSAPVPDADPGDDSFSYEVSDGRGGTARGTVTVRRKGPPTPTAGPLRIVDRGPDSRRVEVRFDGSPGRAYRLEGAVTINGPWVLVSNAVADPGGVVALEQGAEGDAGFFRVVEP